MKTTDFLAEIIRVNGLKDRYGGPGTHYSLWKHMHAKYGWSTATVVNYFNGKTFPGEDQALQIAEELNLEPGYVIVCIEAERAKNPYVKAALEDAAERLKGQTKKPATRRAGSKSAKVASVILSLGIMLGLQAHREEAPIFSENFAKIEYVSAAGGEEDYVLCQIADLSLIGFLLALSILAFQLAQRPGALIRLANKNNKNQALGGLPHDGRNPAGLPHPGRLVTGSGGQVVRLFPENLPTTRGRRLTTRGRAAIIEIQSRLSSRMGRIPDRRPGADPAGRHPITSQHTGGMALCASVTERTDSRATEQNCRAGGPPTAQHATEFSGTNACPGTGTDTSHIPAARSASSASTPGATDQRSPARHFVRAAALAVLGFGTAAQADAIVITGPSRHTDSNYYEHNNGACYEKPGVPEPDLFTVACLFTNSHKEPAAALALGHRWSVAPLVKVGITGGFSISKKHYQESPSATGKDDESSEFMGYGGGLLNLGTDAVSVQMIFFPKIASTPGVRWLQVRFGF